MTVEEIRIFGEVEDSIVDGPGLRYAVFTQGCSHDCKGCHNPESHDFNGGYLRKIEDVVKAIESNGLISGVTLTGGDPFDQAEASCELARRVKSLNYNLWTYTGYRYEQLSESDDSNVLDLLRYSDVLVDGPFIADQKSMLLKWKGSANQRVIDLNKTRETGTVMEWKEEFDVPSIPKSW